MIRNVNANVKAGVRCVVAAAVLLLAIPAAHLAAQTHGSAVLSGVVIDPDGKPVANASVTYQSGGGTAPHAIRTDDRGRFSVMKLRADNYDVRASSKGLFSEWEKNVIIRPGKSRTLTLKLLRPGVKPAADAKAAAQP